MVAPARNRVAAAAAMAVPDLDVIFICILQKKCEGASPASSDSSSRKRHPKIVTRRVWPWLHAGPNLFQPLARNNEGPAAPDPRSHLIRRSTLDELGAHGGARLLGSRREILALAGVGRALAGALALAGVAGHALALGGVRRRRHRRHHRAGEEQGGSGSGERRTGFGIQLHDDLLDDCLKTKVTP